jgi:hypothetical protein
VKWWRTGKRDGGSGDAAIFQKLVQRQSCSSIWMVVFRTTILIRSHQELHARSRLWLQTCRSGHCFRYDVTDRGGGRSRNRLYGDQLMIIYAREILQRKPATFIGE